MLWISRTGSPWRDLPVEFWKWNTIFKRYRDWIKAGVFEKIFAAVNDAADLEYAMIDGTIVGTVANRDLNPNVALMIRFSLP